MTTIALPQLHNSALAAQQLNLLNINAAVSTPSSAAISSSICSTPVTVFSPGYQPLLQYIQPPNQYNQTPSMVPPAANIFEGVPIFLLPQSPSSSVTGSQSYGSYQRTVAVAEMKANSVTEGRQSPKVDTSKHFHVFVGDLATEVDNSALKAAFESFGEISEARVIRDPQTLKSRGYGFVSFPLKENAEKAIDQMNGQLIGRRQIRTNWAIRRPTAVEESVTRALTYDDVFNATHAANTSVYVGSIAPATTEEELMESFSAIATVGELRLFKQQGYAFVRYLTKEAAARAITSMNGKEINGQKIRCSWGRTPIDCNNVSKQALVGMNLLTASNILGFNPIVNAAVAWNQNQCLSSVYGQPLLHSWQPQERELGLPRSIGSW